MELCFCLQKVAQSSRKGLHYYQTHTHTHIHAHTHTHTHTLSLIHASTHVHTHTHSFTHSYIHAHAHKHTEAVTSWGILVDNIWDFKESDGQWHVLVVLNSLQDSRQQSGSRHLSTTIHHTTVMTQSSILQVWQQSIILQSWHNPAYYRYDNNPS